MESSMIRTSLVSALLFATALVACSKDTPPEPDMRKDPASNVVPNAASQATLNLGLSGPAVQAKVAGGDPLDGVWTLADATNGINGTGALIATINTSEGALRCKLFDDKAPVTVANFIGLARGTRVWKDPSGKWVNKPAYDGTLFHRIIKGFMIQGGDAKGNGSGEPGYVIKDELWEGGKHDRAGLLCMANRGPSTNGAQFFITDASAPHLDRSYTILGECGPVETVHTIANVAVNGEQPVSPVTIKTVTIAREKPGPATAPSSSATPTNAVKK
jgi:peptidyl-prolyl cis-trans isomerase A (cyclophilin A)